MVFFGPLDRFDGLQGMYWNGDSVKWHIGNDYTDLQKTENIIKMKIQNIKDRGLRQEDDIKLWRSKGDNRDLTQWRLGICRGPLWRKLIGAQGLGSPTTLPSTSWLPGWLFMTGWLLWLTSKVDPHASSSCNPYNTQLESRNHIFFECC